MRRPPSARSGPAQATTSEPPAEIRAARGIGLGIALGVALWMALALAWQQLAG